MPRNGGAPRRRRARPVADAPIDALLPSSEQLAKGWLLDLLEQAPLGGAPAILGGGLVTEGPRLCDAVLRALTDDLELRRLEPGGALAELAAASGLLAGAATPAAVARTVEALRGTVWAALRRELRDPDPDLVSDLAERLALVCETLRVAALEEGAEAPAAEPPVAEPAEPRAAEPSPPVVPESPPVVPDSPPVVPEPPPRRPAADRATVALWVSALEDEIDNSGGGALSLLLIELEDADRVLAAEGSAGASATFDLFAHALRGAARAHDILVRETDTRAWIMARDTERAGAIALGSRIAEAVATGTRWRGAPLTATVGLAVLGEDGHAALELIDAAEEARFAASASGTDISP